MAYESGRGRIVLLGGQDFDGKLDDIWEWDESAWTVQHEPSAREFDSSSPAASRLRSFGFVLRSELRSLVAAQESYFADHTTYTGSLPELLSEDHLSRLSEGVRITITSASQLGFAALAVHAEVPDARCGVFVGTAAPPFDAVLIEGEPACEGFPN